MELVVPIAGQVVQVLAPFLPYLAGAGEKLGARAAERVQDQGFDLASKLWERLGTHLAAHPAAHEAVSDLAAQPNDEDAQAALRVQLRKLLLDDPDLRQAIESVLADARPSGSTSTTTVTVRGDRSVGIGGNVQGSTIITGDQLRPPPG